MPANKNVKSKKAEVRSKKVNVKNERIKAKGARSVKKPSPATAVPEKVLDRKGAEHEPAIVTADVMRL